MKLRITHSTPIAAAKAGFSPASAYRCEANPSLPSQKVPARTRTRPEPLAGIWDEEAVAMLQAAPALRAVGGFEEICRRHPELAPGVRRALERRVRYWRAVHGLEPWQGFAPDIGDDGDLANRPGIVLVPPSGVLTRSLHLTLDDVPAA